MEEILKNIAPCGLWCGKCFAFKDSDITKQARALAEALGENFKPYSEMFGNTLPEFNNYDTFRDLLDLLAEEKCDGCRNQKCMFFDCRVRECVIEKGVDFCYECDEFPCQNHNFSKRLAKIWQNNNEEMKEKGIGEYYEKTKPRHRYP